MEFETFWFSIFWQPAERIIDVPWIPVEEVAQANITSNIWENIDEEIFKLNLKKL